MPFVIAMRATIRPTPSPTPTAVSIVRAGRRSRLRQTGEVQVTGRLRRRRRRARLSVEVVRDDAVGRTRRGGLLVEVAVAGVGHAPPAEEEPLRRARGAPLDAVVGGTGGAAPIDRKSVV